MATLPAIPSFATDEAPSISKLNQMSTAVQFLTTMPIVVSLKRSSTQAVAANTNTPVQWNAEEVDSDGMHSASNASRLTCVTQGYYKFRATIAMTELTSTAYMSVWFQQTTGVNNPAGAGTTVIFGRTSFYSNSDTGVTEYRTANVTSMTPCLYVGDYVEVYCFSSLATSLFFNWFASGNLDNAGFPDGSCCLYGNYVCEGP